MADLRRGAGVKIWQAILLALTLGGIGGLALAQTYPSNQLPMYGSQPKTEAVRKAEDGFIRRSVAEAGSRAAASDKRVALGWRSFSEHRDLGTAMRRFNQAWLLDPDNGDAYHGFALVVFTRDRDAGLAEELFERAIAAPRQNTNAFVDYGRFLLMTGRPERAVPLLEKAIERGGSSDARALLALAWRDQGDAARACAEARKVPAGTQMQLRREIDSILNGPDCSR